MSQQELDSKIRHPLAARLVLSGMLLILLPTFALADAWYNSTWQYRQQITIPAASYGSVAVSNFPLLVSISGANSVFTNAKSNGYDILFTASDGVTKLAHEIESYDPVGDKLNAWVNIPSLPSSGSTIIYMYYGNAASANQQNKTGVWDSNYKMVLHLSEPATAGQSSAVFYDSTANGANGTQWGTSTTTGKMASGQSFTETYPGDPPTPAGGNDLINVDNFPTDTWTSFTIESWVYLTGINSITPNPLMRIVNKSNGTLTTNIIMGLSLSYSAPNFDVRAILTDSSANTFTYFSSQAPQYILMNGWHLLGARWDGSNISVFIDGNFIGQTATTDIGATLAASAVNQNMVLGNNLLTDTDRTLVGPSTRCACPISGDRTPIWQPAIRTRIRRSGQALNRSLSVVPSTPTRG